MSGGEAPEMFGLTEYALHELVRERINTNERNLRRLALLNQYVRPRLHVSLLTLLLASLKIYR